MMKKIILAAAILYASCIAAFAQVTGPFPVKLSGQLATVGTVKAAAGRLIWGKCLNPNAAVSYLQMYDTAGAITVGTTVAKASVGIPANAQVDIGPFQFFNSLKVAATTTSGGNTAPGAGLDCNFGIN